MCLVVVVVFAFARRLCGLVSRWFVCTMYYERETYAIAASYVCKYRRSHLLVPVGFIVVKGAAIERARKVERDSISSSIETAYGERV